jgi:hypothetical protein
MIKRFYRCISGTGHRHVHLPVHTGLEVLGSLQGYGRPVRIGIGAKLRIPIHALR